MPAKLALGNKLIKQGLWVHVMVCALHIDV